MRIADGPVVLVSSPICHQVAVSGSHMRSAVRRNLPSTARDPFSDHAGVPAVHLTRLSSVREAYYPDRERASRSSLLACLPPR